MKPNSPVQSCLRGNMMCSMDMLEFIKWLFIWVSRGLYLFKKKKRERERKEQFSSAFYLLVPEYPVCLWSVKMLHSEVNDSPNVNQILDHLVTLLLLPFSTSLITPPQAHVFSSMVSCLSVDWGWPWPSTQASLEIQIISF